MVRAAALAVAVARRLNPLDSGRDALTDLQARAWAELGNAYRVADELRAADRALARAMSLSAAGSGCPMLKARVLELTGALRAHQLRFQDAFRNLDDAAQLYRKMGDREGDARVHVSWGLYVSFTGGVDTAMYLLQRGFELARDSSPELCFLALHNIVRCLAEKGQFREARRQLFDLHRLHRKHGGRMDSVRLRLLEAEIAVGLGELKRAEWGLLAAKKGFEEAGLTFHSAIADLELAAVHLRQGRQQEAYDSLQMIVEAFQEIGVSREAIGVVSLLAEAVRRSELSVALLDATVSTLLRLDHTMGAHERSPARKTPSTEQ